MEIPSIMSSSKVDTTKEFELVTLLRTMVQRKSLSKVEKYREEDGIACHKL